MIYSVYKTVAIANQPDFSSHTAEDDGRSTESLFGMLLHALNGETEPVMAAQRTGNTYTELMAAGVGWHFADITTDEQHGIAAIGHKRAMATLGF